MTFESWALIDLTGFVAYAQDCNTANPQRPKSASSTSRPVCGVA